MTQRAGFPHSEICGSKRVCSLPAAYRKLLRPSSPVIAKASTMCTYSLVPITLAPATKQGAFIGIRSTLCCYVCRYIQSLPIHSTFRLNGSINNLYFYFFQIVKEQNSI